MYDLQEKHSVPKKSLVVRPVLSRNMNSRCQVDCSWLEDNSTRKWPEVLRLFCTANEEQSSS